MIDQVFLSESEEEKMRLSWTIARELVCLTLFYILRILIRW
jgi:hypothetical protein